MFDWLKGPKPETRFIELRHYHESEDGRLRREQLFVDGHYAGDVEEWTAAVLTPKYEAEYTTTHKRRFSQKHDAINWLVEHAHR